MKVATATIALLCCCTVWASTVLAEKATLPEIRPGGYPGHWAGRFIWDAGDGTSYHTHLMARRSVVLDRKPDDARLIVTAADRYMVYVNGEYVGRGPARNAGPQWTSFDTYDVTALLRTGKNVVAVLAYYYGCPNAFARDQRSGLFAELHYVDGEKLEIVGTDEQWRVRRAQGYRRDVGLVNYWLGIPTEVLDANKDPTDWNLPEFNDGDWDRARIIENPYRWTFPEQRSSWSYLEPRMTPQLREREVFPERIVKTAETTPADMELACIDVAKRLAAEGHRQVQRATVEEPEAVLAADGRGARLQSGRSANDVAGTHASHDALILVDLGRPVLGFPRLRLDAPAGAVVEITYGPELTEGQRIPTLVQVSRFGSRYITREGQQTWQLFHARLVRYMQVVVRSTSAPVSLDSASVVAWEYPAERRGSFECSDPVLTTLWKASADTVYLQMEDTFTIDPVRERRAYALAGELEQGHMAIYAAYGDLPITDWAFRLTKRGQLPDGLLRLYLGGESLLGFPRPKAPIGSNNPLTIPTFSLFYAQAVRNRHLYFDKPEVVREQYPALVRIAEWCQRHADDDGLLYNLPQWLWIDHVPNEVSGANFELNALYCRMLEDMAQLAPVVNRPDEASLWQRRASQARESLRRLHWNAKRGLFADSYLDGRQVEIFTELGNAMAVLFDIADAEQRRRIIRELAEQDEDLVQVSPLFFFYVIEGLIAGDAESYAYHYMHRRYAPAMELSDFPTLREHWVGHGDRPCNSSIHGGGAGVAWTLTRSVLGIEPDGIGFRNCRIAPKTGDLAWAHGVLPSARGEIRVAWLDTETSKRQTARQTTPPVDLFRSADAGHTLDDGSDDSRFVLEAALPENLPTELVVPLPDGKATRVFHNGNAIDIEEHRADDAIILNVPGGAHQIRVYVQ